MPSLQSALPPELADNVIRVRTLFCVIKTLILHYLWHNLQVILNHGCLCCSFTVSASEEPNSLANRYYSLLQLSPYIAILEMPYQFT